MLKVPTSQGPQRSHATVEAGDDACVWLAIQYDQSELPKEPREGMYRLERTLTPEEALELAAALQHHAHQAGR